MLKTCIRCGSNHTRLNGINIQKYYKLQKVNCMDCNKNWSYPIVKLHSKNIVKQRYFEKNIINIGYLDIETDGQLKGDYGTVVSAVLIIRNVITEKIKTYKLVVTKKEIDSSLDFDKRLLTTLFKLIPKCDLLIGHYFNGWKKFDMPFLRVRAIQLKIKIPVYHQIRYGDTWNMAHSILNLQGYSLGNVARGLGLKNIKTVFDAHTWKMSRRGDKKALDKVLHHNLNDSILTYRIHKKLEKFVPIPQTYI